MIEFLIVAFIPFRFPPGARADRSRRADRGGLAVTPPLSANS